MPLNQCIINNKSHLNNFKPMPITEEKEIKTYTFHSSKKRKAQVIETLTL